MSAEHSPKGTTPKERLKLWSTATLISAGVTAASIYGCDRIDSDVPSENCKQLTSQSALLEHTLFQEGTLGVERAGTGLLASTYTEIRNPMDPRLQELGKLKNERDKQCTADRTEYYNSKYNAKSGAVALTMLGTIATLAGLNRIRDLTEELKDKTT